MTIQEANALRTAARNAALDAYVAAQRVRHWADHQYGEFMKEYVKLEEVEWQATDVLNAITRDYDRAWDAAHHVPLDWNQIAVVDDEPRRRKFIDNNFDTSGSIYDIDGRVENGVAEFL